MSRRHSEQSHFNRPRQSSASSSAAGGRVRGRGRGHSAPSPAQTSYPPPAQTSSAASLAPSTSAPPRAVAPVPASAGPGPSRPPPVQASPAPVPGSGAVATTAPFPAVQSVTSALEKQLTLETSIPSSSKALRCPDRPGVGKVGRQVLVRANHFHARVAVQDIYHYDVAITPKITSKKLSRNVIDLLVQGYRESILGNCVPAYDGGKNLFTAGPFPFESNEFKVKLGDNDEPGSSATPTSSRKKREREFRVTIRFASKTDLRHLTQFISGSRLDCPKETIWALGVVLRATPSKNFDVVGRSFFSSALGPKGPLGSGIEYWRGHYQSLRPTQMGLSLNIDVSFKSFYEAISVLDFISKNFSLDLRRPLPDKDRVKIKKALRGIVVQVNNGQNIIRHYKVTAVTQEPLRALTFNDDNGTKKSVVQYFQEKYNISLQYTHLSALQAGSDTKLIFLPMELCEIVAGQRYTERLNADQVVALLQASCQRPRNKLDSIRETVRQGEFSTDKFAQHFKIEVSKDPALFRARILPSPTLKYASGGESDVQPSMGAWKMNNKKMIDAGKVERWTCLNFSRSISERLQNTLCQNLARICRSKGMVFSSRPAVPMKSFSSDNIKNGLVELHEKCKQANVELQLLIIILPDVKGSYGKIKRICETELGIVSQCCQPKKVDKMNNQFLESLALKINVKVNGTNVILKDTLPQFSDAETIIFGADVTHPSPRDDSSPSIAAVVASMDWPDVKRYKGVVSAQTRRVEIIQDLFVGDPAGGTNHSGIIRELLKAFYISTGKKKPKRIIFYRDGVGEGQFNQVLLLEMDAIRKACCSLDPEYLPRVTFVVVQKRHHTRLFPDYKSGNIEPGTVVDTHICHPREFDFYLNSHAGILGTSRPTHYHVLFDENNFTADELQRLTNNLCYTYARCTRSVSIVSPVYYAHLAAFRARYYIEGDISEAGSSASFEVKLPSVMDNVANVMFFC